jgi:hypothetical protein
MKIFIRKISLLVIVVLTSFSVHASLEISIAVLGSKNVIANGGQFDASEYGDAIEGVFPITVTIQNTGASTVTLNQVSGKYINLSGNGASDYSVNESGIAASIAAGASTTFTVSIASGATNGAGKVVTVSISSNDNTDNHYVGNIKYTFTNKTTSTALTKASDIGLSLYPNPSNDGHMFVFADNVQVNRIVVSNVTGQTEEFVSKEFTTSLKGLLLVRVYTDKGVVFEKIIIKE